MLALLLIQTETARGKRESFTRIICDVTHPYTDALSLLAKPGKCI